jgi:WD40 repeat protein
LTEDELRSFDWGLLPVADIDRVTAHLESGCRQCADRLDQLSGEDDLGIILRMTAGTGTAALSAAASRYQIVTEIGHGGMGTVFQAVDRQSGRTVALKQLTGNLARNPVGVARFRQEVKALASIEHPHVVRLYDSDLDSSAPFLVMEWVDGEPLSQRLNGRPLPPSEAARLIQLVAEAVHAAHVVGILHRDLKPGNILITRAGEPKVSDFGLARPVGGLEGRLTEAGVLVGTPEYMPPEQALGEWTALTPAADVYGLGATLYELLTGRPPFRGPSTLSVLDQVRGADPLPPNQLQPGVPGDLQTICLKCLEKVPTARYESAAALAQDLERWQRGRPILARPAGRIERALKWARRNTAIAWLVAAVVVTMVAGLAVSTTFAVLASGRADAARRAEDHATRQAADEQRSREEAEAIAYRLTMRDADREWVDGRADKAVSLLATCPERLQGWEWHYLVRRCGQDESLVAAQAGGILAFGLLRDGKRIRFLGADGRIRVVHLATRQSIGEPLAVCEPQAARGAAVAFDRTGQFLAVRPADDPRITLWDLDRGHRIRDWEFPSYPILALSRDGGRLAAGSADGFNLAVWDTATGDAIFREQVGKVGDSGLGNQSLEKIRSLAFSSDGQRLAMGTRDRAVVWNLSKKEQPRLVPGHHRFSGGELHGVLTVALTGPDDSLLVTGAYVDPRVPDRAELLLHDLRGGQLPLVLADDLRRYEPFGISGDGSRLAYQGGRGTVVIRDVATGNEVARVRTVGQLPAPTFAPDGTLVVGTGRGVEAWDTAHPLGGDIIQQGGKEGVFGLVVSEDGRIVIFTAPGDAAHPQDVRLCVWDRAAGRAAAFLSLGVKKLAPSALALSRDGKSLAVGLPRGQGVQVWDWRNQNQLALLTGASGDVPSVAFTDSGRVVAGINTGQILEWDLQRPSAPRELYRHFHHLVCLAFSPDGTMAAVGGSGPDGSRVAVIKVESGKVVQTLTTDATQATSVAFSPDGRRLAVSTFGPATVQVWDLDTSARLAQAAEAHNQVAPVTLFSADGRRVVTGSHDGTVKVWDAARCSEMLILRSHMAAVNRGVMLPGGLLFTSSWDGTVREWDGRNTK